MCSGLDLGPYLKAQGHTRQLKVRVRMLVSATYFCIEATAGDIAILWNALFDSTFESQKAMNKSVLCN